MERYREHPPALPSADELRARRQRRAERRRLRDQQQTQPAPWPPPGTGLPSLEALEQASLVVPVPMGGRLVVVPVPKPRERTP